MTAGAGFDAASRRALADVRLQSALARFGAGFAERRAAARAAYGEAAFEALRAAGRAIRDRALENLSGWLLCFEQEAKRRGTVVLWAEDHAQLCRHVVEIARRHGVRAAVKSKSMVSEEAGLNAALEAAGVRALETDLGEYILQLAAEPPSHIIAPAIHKTRADVARLFAQAHGRSPGEDPARLTREAREVLRPQFLAAQMGITGANFLVAESGSVVLVTNEGNGRLVTTLPPVHVAIAGIEKVIPTLEDFATLNRLLARSATGQAISNYVSILTGPRAAQDCDGPEHMYVILVDAGRTRFLDHALGEMLRCIRCGACMNHCPVYRVTGGHAYGWVYPGPMGSVLTPVLTGFRRGTDLPQAATLCKACEVVCPVQIPLAELLRRLREHTFEADLRPARERLALRLWAFLALRPRLYGLAAMLLARTLRLAARGRDAIARLPFDPGWTQERDFPVPEGRTFRELWRAKEKRRR